MSDYASALAQRERDVNNTLNGGNGSAALVAALANPPLGCQDESIRDKSLQLVVDCLSSIKDTKGAIDSLDQEQLDTLMKYIYRGLEKNLSPNALLAAHGFVVSKGGKGTIVRALTEKLTV
mmetsp:Transcript_18840/g.47917  ORF Transcript_18840/g.47917 Transcript_18840/m.47917 type:complete len:121 (-) Transcript_18840:6-368(-)|eukprot:CAMPEP_0177648426 /NCGR_PEP_ID=MMETSP0447-20121125/10819_1 /TAXON_ID=0 /ORGANISM="Stygamoeba regulata, Strain BSH-02190019" /LENGTH=120 /DNA_ID=CAMNT_0019151061 /DNA_START=138 /DNA_END=500 /DNA_ORIENTATION=-